MTFAAAIVACASVRPLQAQVEIGAFGGILAPTMNFDLPADGNSAVYGPTEAKLATALTYGALGRLWVAPRLGLQMTLGFTNGSLQVYAPLSSAPDTTSPVSTTAITVTFLYRLSTPSLPNAVWLSFGPMWITEDSPRYEGLDGTSSLGIDFGVGSSLPLNDRFRANLAFDTFVYPFSPSIPTEAPTGGTQLDFRAMVGLSVHFGHDPEP